MKYRKYLKAVVIDIFILLCIVFAFWIAVTNASGMFFPRTMFMDESSLLNTLLHYVVPPLLIIAVCYFGLSLWRKHTVGWLLCNKQQWRKARLLFAAAIIDFCIAFAFTLLINYMLQGVIYIETFQLLFLVMLGYAIIAGIFQGYTFGRWLFGVSLNAVGSQKPTTATYFKYELYKYSILIAFPYFFLKIIGIIDSYAIFLDLIFIDIVITLFPFIVLKKTLWSYFAGVSNNIEYRPVKKMAVPVFILTLFFMGSYTLIRYFNNKYQPSNMVLFGFHYPYKFSEYPHTKKVQTYVDYLNTQTQSPKEYILNLFKQYDIVILQETYHGESTQWEMIGDIVADSAFINNVGHIFTEYGSAIHQNKIDTFLHTVFPNDTALEQATAVLMDYMSGGFYYFIKNLNLLNAGLPEHLKVHEHYTDVIDWDYFSNFSRKEAGMDRDSLMAQITVDWYKQQLAEGKRHKCLVVTNTRHALGYAGGIKKLKNTPYFRHLTQGNQGQYIWEAIPDKTAAVMQLYYPATRALFYPIHRPIQRGIWDKAYEINNYKPTGFDLKNTPFGNDLFDAYFMRGAKTTLQYADIFTGIIFNKPYMSQREVYHPYGKYAMKQEAIRKGIINNLSVQQRIEWYGDESFEDSNMRWATILAVENFAGIFCFLILAVVSIIMSILFLLKRIIYRRKYGL